MEKINGQTSEDRLGRRDQRISENQQSGLGEVGDDSGVYGVEEQSGFTAADSERANTPNWKLHPIRDTTVGKILKRIESLEARHIKYVDSHESRLSARLEAARVEKEEFIQEANQIKSDIYHLAIAQQKANGNGHIN